MSVKMECDNCHTQVTGEGMGNHGWIMVTQQLLFQQLGEVPVQGTFCTISCTLQWLSERDPAKVTIETPPAEVVQKVKDNVHHSVRQGRPAEEELRRTYGEGDPILAQGMSLFQFSGKAGEILRKVVGTDEPIAIFRARDLLSIFPLANYATMLERYGAHYDQQESWGQVRDDFRTWQNAHSSELRLPD